MQLLIDQNVPRSVADYLETRGHAALHVKDVLGPTATDQVIVAYANRIGAVVVTWNHKHFKREVTRATQQKRRVGRISFCCPENMGVQRAKQCMELVEAEYGLAQQRHDKRILIEIRRDTIVIVV